MTRHIALLFALVLMAAPGAARAQEGAAKQKAARLLDEGVNKYSNGDYGGALDKFQAAYAAYASPKIFLNMGEALRRMGRDLEAAEAYSRYLAETPPGEIRDDKRRLATQGLDELQPRVGRLRVDAPQPGAQLALDGKTFKPVAERPAWVLPGTHSITATAPGFVAKTMWVEVHAGEEKKISIALDMVGAAKPIEKPIEPKPVEPVSPTPPSPTIDQPTTETHHGRTWTWVAAGAAGAMLLVGIIEGMAASSDFDEYKKTTDPMKYDQLKNDISSESTIANVMFIGAGVAAVGAGVLYWWEGRDDGGSRAAVTPAVSANMVGLMVLGRF